jgi:hypothetical protein
MAKANRGGFGLSLKPEYNQLPLGGSAMNLCLRSCVECPRCHTRYIIGGNPYRNGSYISDHPSEGSDVRSLYCCCAGHFDFFPFKLSELKTYSVSQWAYNRGYGSPDEIVFADHQKKAS